MSKKIQAIIAGSVVLVLLVGVMIALILTNKPADDKENTSSTSSVSLITLAEGSVDDLEYINIKNQKDEYKIEVLGEKKWGIKALDGFKQIDGMFSTTATSVINLYAQEIIEENATDLAKYGFDKPTLETEIKLKGKDILKITLGDLSPDQYTRYVIKTGENTVYGMSSSAFSNLLNSAYDYLDKNIVAPPETGEDGNPKYPSIEGVTLTTTSLEKPIILEPYKPNELSENSMMAAALKLVSPINGMVNETKLQDNVFPVFGLTASSVEAINPTKEQLTKYGFDTPTSSLIVKYDKTFSFNVIVGAPIMCTHKADEDLTNHTHKVVSYYVMREGTPVIYVVAAENLKWLDVKRNTFLSSLAVLPPIVDIDGVDFVAGKNKYEITYKKGPKYKDDTDDMTAAVNGKEVKLDPAKKMLQLFYATSIQDVNVDFKPTKAPDASLSYHYSDGRKDDKVEFYIMGDRQVVISLNGNMGYIGRSGYIEVMTKNVEKLIAGEEVDTDW